MKKLITVLPVAALLLLLTATIVSAGVDWEDPALCVNGQWLFVDAAHPSAVTVSLPRGARFGGQAAGGCATSMNVPLITRVRVRGDDDEIHVQINGKFASTPSVQATYGAFTQSKRNNGHEELNFRFHLQNVPFIPPQ